MPAPGAYTRKRAFQSQRYAVQSKSEDWRLIPSFASLEARSDTSTPPLTLSASSPSEARTCDIRQRPRQTSSQNSSMLLRFQLQRYRLTTVLSLPTYSTTHVKNSASAITTATRDVRR